MWSGGVRFWRRRRNWGDQKVEGLRDEVGRFLKEALANLSI
jgi:hypothetical protein